jgi:hypothetical protein
MTSLTPSRACPIVDSSQEHTIADQQLLQPQITPEELAEFNNIYRVKQDRMEKFSHYYNKSVMLRSTMSTKDILTVIDCVGRSWDCFLVNYCAPDPHYSSWRGEAIQNAFEFLSGRGHVLDPKGTLFLAMIKDKILQHLIYEKDWNKKVSLLKAFKAENPTWFKTGGTFTLLTQPFLTL